MSFWDSSALVPLCLNEYLSQNARMLWRRFPEHFIWRETPVEIASAIARRMREGSIDDVARIKSENRLSSIEEKWSVIKVNDRLISLARTFPMIHRLRALDSLQLAAALVWCKEFPKKKDFVTADARLSEAAERVGFTVHYLY